MFLLTKLLRATNAFAAVRANSATGHHSCSLTFLRGISSNTWCAAPELSSTPVNPQAAEVSTAERSELKRNFTVSYLVESCGLSPKDAASAFEKVRHFATPERPSSVLDLLRSNGFNSTQITHIVKHHPLLLLANAEKTISPKLEFLLSMGLSENDLARRVSYSPSILKSSLKNQMEPVCNFIKSFVLSNENVGKALKRSPWLLLQNHEKFLVPNVALLQEEHQVPDSCISLMLIYSPHVLMQNHEELSAVVSKVKEMGFNPSKSTFVLALKSISGRGKKLLWDRCYKIYSTKWGWSKEDILTAFKKHPHCMNLSEKKIDLAMDFLVNTMGLSSKGIAHQPNVLLLSLEKRTIPRCSVIRVLWAKGLVRRKTNMSLSSILNPAEETFLKRYVTKYEEQVPQLLCIYKGEMDVLDLV